MRDFKGPWRCLILLIVLFSNGFGQVYNVQRCTDPQCQGVVSEGRTVLKYHANSNSMLSFGMNQPVKIFSKGDGQQQDIWGVEINGKRGFANRRHLQETRVYSRNLGYVAPPHASYYEVQLNGPGVANGQQQEQPQAQPTQPPPHLQNGQALPMEQQQKQQPPLETPQLQNQQPQFQNEQPQFQNEQPQFQQEQTQQQQEQKQPQFQQAQNQQQEQPKQPQVQQEEQKQQIPVEKPQEQTQKPVEKPLEQVQEEKVEEKPEEKPLEEPLKQPLEEKPEEKPLEKPLEQPQEVKSQETPQEQPQEKPLEQSREEKPLEQPQEVKPVEPQEVSDEPEMEPMTTEQPEIKEDQTDEAEKLPSETPQTETFTTEAPQQYPEIPSQNEEFSTEAPLIQDETMQLPLENEFEKSPNEIHYDIDEHYAEHQQNTDSIADETVLHYVEFLRPFVPEWVHKTLHWGTVDGVSPKLSFLTFVLAFTFLFVYLIHLLVEKSSREAPLKAEIAAKDKELFKARNELMILKREVDEGMKNNAISTPQVIENSPPKTKEIIKEVAPKALILELDSLKYEKEQISQEKEVFKSQCDQLTYYQQELEGQIQNLNGELGEVKNQLYQAQQELSEAESVVQECVEEKKKLNNVNSVELVKAIDTLRDQLNSQKEAVHKYEGKIKRRESELKEKTQELRKLRAETANAKLQVDKITSEKEHLETKVQSLEAFEVELTDKNSEMQVQISVLEGVKVDLNEAKEKLDEKEAELESANNELAVLKETVLGLKAAMSKTPMTNSKSDNGFESGDGWEVEDDVDLPENEENGANSNVSYEAICDTARLRVDLQKAQSACETLSEQLMAAEAVKEKLEVETKDLREEAETARKAKEAALEEKVEMTKKHEVLTVYFNQREAELQKQLGVQTERLGAVEVDSESVSKKLNMLYDELESYKSQCSSLKQEMEEQERSLKSQNAQLEKKQHESWVTVRQESRKLTEAQNEMQTLRTRLTVAESKLAEKTVEIEKLMEENRAMKESMDRINNHQILKPEAIYANGNDLPSLSSGPGSITEELPPELPPLPFLPIMQPAPPPLMYPADSRPAPLGRRSPPHGGRGNGRYSRSPSPYHSDNRRGSYHRDVSPAPSDRSDRSSRYASSAYDYDEGRYSPPYPPRHRRRHSRDDRSPDRYSSRSERSDYEREYRDTPPRENRRRGSRTEATGDYNADYDNDYHRRDKRRDRVKDRHGPKTSSPMM